MKELFITFYHEVMGDRIKENLNKVYALNRKFQHIKSLMKI
jgi:hypothetical protein